MPFEARKRMKWGPGRNPVQLEAGDEVPLPIKRVLLQNEHVAKVESFPGVAWADRPEEVRKAWAECNGLSFLSEKRKGEADPVTVQAVSHPTRLVDDEASAPPVRSRRQRARPRTVEPSPAKEAEPEDKPAPAKKKRRGRPRKKV
jgi:hypothetical protein